MGRKSRLKRVWRVERLVKEAEAADLEEAAYAPVSDRVLGLWVLATAVSWWTSLLAGSAGLGIIPLLVVSALSARFERGRGRPKVAVAWLVLAGLWWAALVVLPPETVSQLRESVVSSN